MIIECIATYYGFGEEEIIEVEKTSWGVLVNGRKVVNMEYNGIQLRLEMTKVYTKDVYIVFDEGSESNMTIKEMYETLK